MRVAIIGSRGYPALDEVRAFVRSLPAGTMVISGGARGVDEVAEDEAWRCGLEVRSFRPNYAAHGARAPLTRNRDIIDAADEVVAFWDGRSRGTRHALNWAQTLGRPATVYEPGKAPYTAAAREGAKP